jgi:hypothetical protein
MRDLGGDAVNRMHWAAALRDSFCCMFIVSLSDYDKKDKGEKSKSKFSVLRTLLWETVVNNSNTSSRVILLLNKQVRHAVLIPLFAFC